MFLILENPDVFWELTTSKRIELAQENLDNSD